MAPFALPVPGYLLGIHPRAAKRRKTGDEQEDEEAESEWDSAPSHLPPETINPLSHPPDVLRQFRVAGLSETDEIPSVIHPLFPHKPLPSEGKKRRARASSKTAGASEAESEAESAAEKHQGKDGTPKQVSERLKHLSTITAIMHRCLGDGDVARAKRAFGLLLRTKEVDIRQGGLWAVGSEILMRDGEAEEQQRRQIQAQKAQRAEDEDDEARLGADDGGSAGAQRQAPPRRWGSAANMDKVKSYFENLIQQHPHDPLRPHLTSALDFWPALFAIEIYNLDAEARRALHQLRAMEEDDEDGEVGGGEADFAAEEMDMDMDMAMAYSDDNPFETTHRQRRDEARQHMAWAARDELRTTTREVAARIAGRMDQVMENAPYATHREMLRLRANLALYVADLHIPSRLLLDNDGGAPIIEGASLSHAEGVLRSRAESAEEYGALARRREEVERARKLFGKILDGGGEVDDWIRRFVLTDDDYDDEGRDVGSDDE
ncbi:hypothetical protein F5Y05DRAFT_420871 [Hypoxylon sp. FL0543]|nr:hypothetical protein F5Y05DRAFT_420871 [Hypoxylon sp. FL0543]